MGTGLLWGNENLLKVVAGNAEYAENHWVVYSK